MPHYRPRLFSLITFFTRMVAASLKSVKFYYQSYFLFIVFVCSFLWSSLSAGPKEFSPGELCPVKPGIDVLMDSYGYLLKGKRIGLLTTQIMLDSSGTPTYRRFKAESGHLGFTLKSLFAPEHGFWAGFHASEKVSSEKDEDGLIIHTLYGSVRHPTKEQLKEIDLMIIDLQDVGVRCYTYASSAFYVMESCAAEKIPVIILDRPNPINGVVVDGPCLEKGIRSFVGYIDVAFCHGMTLGELCKYFNQEYKVSCDLSVIPMKGWKRSMSYGDTRLPWLGSSPQIPSGDTPLYYALTCLVCDLNWFNCGVGYTQPFKLMAHPEADPTKMLRFLESQKLSGIHFYPAYYKPFSGTLKLKLCKGLRFHVYEPRSFKPFQAQMLLFEMLKKLYPQSFRARLEQMKPTQAQMFDKIWGIKDVRKLILESSHLYKAIEERQSKQMQQFRSKRAQYLIPDYS